MTVSPREIFIEHFFSADVATGGSFTLSYPAETDSHSFLPDGHRMWHPALASQVLNSPTGFAVSFGASSITITYKGSPTLKVGTRAKFHFELDPEGSYDNTSERIEAVRSRVFGTRALAAAATIPSGQDFIQTAGYSTAGDGGGALYKRVSSEPSHAGKFQSADGAWFEIAEAVPTPLMLGAVGDNSTDDTEALQDFADLPFDKLHLGEGHIYRITGTVTFPANVDLDFGSSQVVYAGTRDRPAIVHGESGVTNTARISNVHITASTIDWSNDDFVGFRLINASRAKIQVRAILQFTVGWECYSLGQGYTNSQHNITTVRSCKRSIALTADGSAGELNYVNENSFFGGDATNHSNSLSLGDSAGIWFRAVNDGYTGHNLNRFYSYCFQPGDGQSGDVRVPVYFDGVGSRNLFFNCRHEGGRGPAMVCRGDDSNIVTGNIFYSALTLGDHAEAAISESGTARLNYFITETEAEWTQSEYTIRDIPKLVKSYSSTTTTVMGGLHLTDSTGSPSLFLSHASNVIRCLKDSLELTGSRSLGFFITTPGSESFSVLIEAEDGHYGRVGVSVYDEDFVQLTDSSGTYPDVKDGYTATYNHYSSSWGGSYVTTTDGSQFSFTVSSTVRYIRVFAIGGTASLRIKSLGIRRLTRSRSPIQAFSGLTSNPLVHYASSDPDGGVNGVYARGDIAVNTAAGTGQLIGWQCSFGGRLAPAWPASTAVAVGHLCLNDTSNIYICVTAGTTASSGGPTGTGTAIEDGTAIWDYLSSRATFIPMARNGDALTSVSSTPQYVGQFAVSGGVGYMAVGTSSSADWLQITA